MTYRRRRETLTAWARRKGAEACSAINTRGIAGLPAPGLND